MGTSDDFRNELSWTAERDEAYRRARGLGMALLLSLFVATGAVAALIVGALR